MIDQVPYILANLIITSGLDEESVVGTTSQMYFANSDAATANLKYRDLSSIVLRYFQSRHTANRCRFPHADTANECHLVIALKEEARATFQFFNVFRKPCS